MVTEEECNLAGNCGIALGDGCCTSCCQEPCATCDVDPCEGFVCEDFDGLSCQANYCGGCNRQWMKSTGELVQCFNERQFIVDPPPRDNCTETACPLIALDCTCGETIIDCCPACCECNSECESDPCELLLCESNPELRCKPNHCSGTCEHEWFDMFNVRATCDRVIVRNVILLPSSFLPHSNADNHHAEYHPN